MVVRASAPIYCKIQKVKVLFSYQTYAPCFGAVQQVLSQIIIRYSWLGQALCR